MQSPLPYNTTQTNKHSSIIRSQQKIPFFLQLLQLDLKENSPNDLPTRKSGTKFILFLPAELPLLSLRKGLLSE
jgi:hypothetical protein